MDVIQKIVDALQLDKTHVAAAVALLKEGAAVPFIARYRKERVGSLDEAKLWAIKDRLRQFGEFEQRRAVVLKAVTDAGKLTPELQVKIETTQSRPELEDLFMPFRSRRRTRSTAARQKGLEPLAELILRQETPLPTLPPEGGGQTTALPPQAASPAAPAPAISPETVAAQAPSAAAEPPAAAAQPAEPSEAPTVVDLPAIPVEAPTAVDLPATSTETPAPPSPASASTPDSTAAAPRPTAVNPAIAELVKPFINPEKGVKDAAEALAGARDIIAERLAEDAAYRKIARDLLLSEGKIVTRAREGIDLAKGRFAAFAQFSESVAKIPSHRLLAAMHGASEKQLSLTIEGPKEKLLQEFKAKVCTNPDAVFKGELELAVDECLQRLLGPTLDNELRLELKRRADQEAIGVFARHLHAMLMQAPFGPQPVLAILAAVGQPWKAAVVDGRGKVVATLTILPGKKPAPPSPAAVPQASRLPETSGADAGGTPAPLAAAAEATPPQSAPPAAKEERASVASELLLKLIQEHAVKGIAIGNTAGSKDADLCVRELLKANGLTDVVRVVIHDGPSAAYGMSALAREELPDVDVSLRTAASLGRRLQDPLSELLKAELKGINLGQYQHDVDQKLLQDKLEETAASCVSAVGVDLNSASEAALRYVAGLDPELAKAIVQLRKTKGGFQSRDELREVPKLAAKALEQCLGFLRVHNEARPLDATAIHPECYATVDAMAAGAGVPVKTLLGNSEALGKLDLNQFKTEQIGEPTLKDVLAELANPGKDPRGPFVKPEFSDEVADVTDLKEGMVLNGVVTNLAAFGAFVDVGVHQDGLVHISAITHKYIRDPSELLTVGQHVKVKVLGVDAGKKRISLSMKALEAPPAPRAAARPRPAGPRPPRAPRPVAPAGATGSSWAARAAPAGAAAPGGEQPPHRPRTTRFDRPRRPAPGASSTGVPPASGVSAAQASGSAPAAAQAATPGPVAGSVRPPLRTEQGGQARPLGRDRGGRGRDERRGPHAPEPKPAPGMPDYSKFYVKAKRKDRDDRRGPRRDEAGASREEVREVMRRQDAGGTSLGDLLRKAGVSGEEKGK